MSANARFPIGEPYRALLIHKDAFSGSSEQDHVFVVRQGKAERVPVKKGRAYGSLIVTEGDLLAGEPVVVEGVCAEATDFAPMELNVTPLGFWATEVPGLAFWKDQDLLVGAPYYEWPLLVQSNPETARDRLRTLMNHIVTLPEFQLT